MAGLRGVCLGVGLRVAESLFYIRQGIANTASRNATERDFPGIAPILNAARSHAKMRGELRSGDFRIGRDRCVM